MNSTAQELTAVGASENKALVGLARLMRMAYGGIDLAPLGSGLIARGDAEADANALMDLATVLQLRHNRELGLSVQREALALRQLYSPPMLAGAAALRLLAIVAPGDLMSNTPLEFLLEDSDVALDLLYMGADLPFPSELPEHDVLFVAVGESDGNLPLLHALEDVVNAWPRPVLNRPGAIARLARDSACGLLESVPGAVMPATVRAARGVMERLARGDLALTDVIPGGAFPLIVRPVDSHAGHGLEKLDDAAAVTAYLAAQSGVQFFISRFVDYRGPDGLFRKYRIVLIEGQPFVCHMGISGHWMVHYLNAGMGESAAKRAEEARFMETFDAHFAQRHAQAFREIHTRMGLDYLGIDCGETADGRLLLFEVDSNMIVHAMDPADLFPYKQPQMRKVFDAFRAMLGRAAQRGGVA